MDWTGGGYSAEELGGCPRRRGLLGCGNPTVLATLSAGRWSWTWAAVAA